MTRLFSTLSALFAAAALLLLAAPAAAQTVIYVDADASAPGDGATWDSAYPALQDAFDQANDNPDTDYEIWVAGGTYYPDEDNIGDDHGDDDTYEAFTLTRDGVALYGGFDGSETSRSGRDVAGNAPAVLSGDIEQDDAPFEPTVDSDGDSNTATQTDHINSDNSDNVLYFDGASDANITSATVLDGVTVASGRANNNSRGREGAGLYCDGEDSGNECSPKIVGVSFEGNAVGESGYGGGNGGAIYLTARDGGTGSPQIDGCAFIGNYASQGGGGAIYFEADSRGVSQPQITNTTFTNNRALESGGAIHNDGEEGLASPTLTNVTFTGNVATGTSRDGDADGSGGAIFNDVTQGGRSEPTITDATFTGNEAEGSGGAIFSITSGTDGIASSVITNTTFAENTADVRGGALYHAADGSDDGATSSPVIVNSVFTGNTAGVDGSNDRNGKGGAIYSYGEYSAENVNPAIINTTFAGNTAEESVFDAGTGGAIYNLGSAPTITNTVFWDNTAEGGSGDQLYNTNSETTVTLRHTLLGGGTAGVSNNDGASTVYEDDGGADVAFAQSTNFDTDPRFMAPGDPDGADDIFATADDGLTLTDGSRALDAGDNDALPADAQDLDDDGDTGEALPLALTGAARVNDNDADPDTPAAVDVGAYEAPDGVQLPVELAGFEATADGASAVRLSWQTASETNNAGFRIQRKRARERGSESAWTTVGSVEGSGTTSQAQSYRFTDPDLPYEADALTYRLKQVDTDGTAHLSKTVTVERGVQELELLGTYPNPARQQATVRYALPDKQEATIRLYDVLGRQVRTVVSGEQEGRHEQRLDTSRLPSGVYFLRLRAGGKTRTQKLSIVQ